MPLKTTIVAFIALWGCGCSAKPGTAANRVRVDCPNSDSAEYFIPSVGYGNTASNHDPNLALTYHRYSEYLRAANFNSLSCGRLGDGYRFAWFPSYGSPLIVDLLQSDSWRVTSVIFDPTQLQPTVHSRNTRTVGDAEAQRIIQALNAAKFWNIPADGGPTANDGVISIIEARASSWYRIVRRLTPYTDVDEGFRLAALEFFRSGNIAIPSGYDSAPSPAHKYLH